MREAAGRATDSGRAGVASLGVAAILAITIYVVAFGSSPVHDLGTDSYAYVAQIRAASTGTLDIQEGRPGVGVTGAFVSGLGIAPAFVVPIVLSIALATCLGLASAVAVRAAFRLPAWWVGPIALVVATWGGTTRLAAGYLANLASVTLFLVAIATIVLRGPARLWFVAASVLFAGLLAHPGVAPAYVAIVIVWGAVSVPRLMRERGTGVPVTRAEPVVSAEALLVSGFVLILVMWWVGLGVGDVADFAGVRGRFDERAAEIVAWIQPWLTVPLMVAGGLVLSRFDRDRTSSISVRVGIAWLLVAAAGLPALILFPGYPFHRALLLGVPAAILIGVALAWAVGTFSAKTTPNVGPVWVAAVAFAIAAGLGSLTVQPFSGRAERERPSVPPTAAAVAGYLIHGRVTGPVVIVMDPASPRAVRDWKRRQNAVRALAPAPIIPDVVVYLGDERTLREGLPTISGGEDAFSELFDAVSRRTWPDVRRVLDRDPAIVVARSWVRPATWSRVALTAASASGELAVLDGPPVQDGIAPAQGASLGHLSAIARAAAVVLLLVAIGGGWAWSGIDGRLGRLEGAGLAPGFGLAVVILAGIVTALFGSDPGGPYGVVTIGAASAAGWAIGARRARGRRSGAAGGS